MKIGQAQVTCYVSQGEFPSPWEFAYENSAFKLDIANGTATFLLQELVSSLEEAEKRVEDFLHSWSADLLLQTGSVRRKFRLCRSYAPSLGGRAFVTGVGSVAHTPESKALLQRQQPWLFHEFEDDPLISSLIARYHDYRKGRERLPVLGYLCLSALQSRFGSRSQLAQECRIDKRVLGRFADRVSMVGTYRTARKISALHHFRDLNDEEHFWLEVVTRELISRAGTVAKGGSDSLSKLSVKDLPPLPPMA